MIRRFAGLFLLFIFIIPTSIFANELFVESNLYSINKRENLNTQLNIPLASADVPVNASLIAISNKDYPVTPGDTYILTYYDPNYSGTSSTTGLLTSTIQVDSDYCATLPYVGNINAKGKTYMEFKAMAEAELSTLYSYLSPNFRISSCGVFEVYVYGEVNYSANVKTWSLARLSDLCSYATKYASSRNVWVEYPDGTEKSYDLYSAISCGNISENPFLQPGMKVRFERAEKTVFVNGSVNKPGQYQINDDDTLSTVIEKYAKGLDFDADSSFITISNFENNYYVSSMIDYENLDDYQIIDMDSIYISSVNLAKPYVTVQGAIDSNSSSQSGKFNYEFFPGETAEQLLRSIRSRFDESTDTSNIYLVRDDVAYEIDVDTAFSTSERGSLVLEQGDLIVVPYNQQYITVSGGVSKPGSYKYEPDRSADYYINLAGGFSTDAKENSIRIFDEAGNIVRDRDNIFPNATISIKRRNTNAVANITFGISLVSFGLTLATAIYNLVD